MNAPLTSPAADVLADSLVSPWADDFPILARPVRNRRLAYLDNGATTQKPRAVIEAMATFYEQSNANIHRGVHWLSQHATANAHPDGCWHWTRCRRPRGPR